MAQNVASFDSLVVRQKKIQFMIIFTDNEYKSLITGRGGMKIWTMIKVRMELGKNGEGISSAGLSTVVLLPPFAFELSVFGLLFFPMHTLFRAF